MLSYWKENLGKELSSESQPKTVLTYWATAGSAQSRVQIVLIYKENKLCCGWTINRLSIQDSLLLCPMYTHSVIKYVLWFSFAQIFCKNPLVFPNLDPVFTATSNNYSHLVFKQLVNISIC